jgi:uncharacterized iron-regulated membrane protein
MHDKVQVKRPKRQFFSPDFVRAMLAGHSALGLAFAALIYIVCITGTVSVFLMELQRWEQPDGPRVTGTLSPEVIAAAVRAGYEQARADNAAHDLFLSAPQRNPQRLMVTYHDHETGIEGEWLADADGRLVARIAAAWSEFITLLHMHLHLPRTWGLYLVGLTGVALLSSLISGILSHPRIFKDAFYLRWGGSRRLQEADLHNRLGVWGLPFHVVVTVTGSLLGLSTLIVGVLAMAAYDGDRDKAIGMLFGPRATESKTAAPVPDVGSLIRQVQQTEPNAEVSTVFIEHVGTAGQMVQLGMHIPGKLAFSETFHFRSDGQFVPDPNKAEAGPGRWILGAIQPLHFGWFGGLPVKILYGVLGLALTVVTHSGVVIWLARRRDKGRPAPGWEKVWAVVGWSQPLALAVTAVAALLAGEKHLVALYLATIAASFALAFVLRDGATTARVLRVLSGFALIGVVATHAYVWWGRIADPMGWWVDAAIIAAALIIGLPALKRRVPRAAVAPAQPAAVTT